MAIEAYGEEAKNGVIIIETKKNLNNATLQNPSNEIVVVGAKAESKNNASLQNSSDKVIVITTPRDKIDKSNAAYVSVDGKKLDEPLLIVDGEKYFPGTFDLKHMDPKNIQSMEVLKGESAIEKYGQEAKDGVIIIKTKSNPNNALIVIDGKKYPFDSGVKILNEINPNNIESISTLYDEKAIEEYGEEGKNGVFIIETK